VARVRRSPQPEGPPQLDSSYIPPVLACDAWSILTAEILQASYHLVGQKLESRAAQVISRNIGFDSRAGQDPQLLQQLHVLNEGRWVLNVGACGQGVHPLRGSVGLCGLVGQLSVCGQDGRVPPLPRYDHDDLGGCFWRVKQYLESLLGKVVPTTTYVEREF